MKLKNSFKYIFFLLFIFFVQIEAQEITLKSKLQKAQPSSWIVTEQNKNFTFFFIRENNGKNVIIEEVCVPSSRIFGPQGMMKGFNWQNWFESGAPGNTLWTISQIDLASGRFIETFSFTHQRWQEPTDSSFFTTLLNLRFQPLAEQERRRIGLAPSYRKQDTRPFWQPKLIVNGTPVKNVKFLVYKTRWPQDGSELARKSIEVYLPDESQEGGNFYPTYFPYWLEVEGKIGSAKVRIIDSGLQATSPKTHFPHQQNGYEQKT